MKTWTYGRTLTPVTRRHHRLTCTRPVEVRQNSTLLIFLDESSLALNIDAVRPNPSQALRLTRPNNPRATFSQTHDPEFKQ